MNPGTPRLALIALGRPTFDVAAAEETLAAATAAMERRASLAGPPRLALDESEARTAARHARTEGAERFVLLHATFSDASLAVAVAGEIPGDLVLWAVPEPSTGTRLRLNSLCGANIAAAALVARGRRVAFVYGPATAATAREVLSARPPDRRAAPARASPAARGGILEGVKVGLVGEAPRGFFASQADPAELAAFGVTLTSLSLAETFARARAVDRALLDPALAGAAQRLSGFEAVPLAQRESSVRAELALRDWVATERLDAVAVECWPAFMTEHGGAVCWAMSRLIDSGVMAGCERDVLGVLTMILETRLAGGVSPFFADLVHVDEHDRVVFWHCGAGPLSLAGPHDPARASVQPNRGVGLTTDFGLRGGRVTIAKLGRAPGGGHRLLLAGGQAEPEPAVFRGNSLTVRLDAPVRTFLKALVERGHDHHLAIVHADVGGALESWAAAHGVAVDRLDTEASAAGAA